MHCDRHIKVSDAVGYCRDNDSNGIINFDNAQRDAALKRKAIAKQQRDLIKHLYDQIREMREEIDTLKYKISQLEINK